MNKGKIIFTDTNSRRYTEGDLRLIWYLHVAEQLKEKLSREMTDAINKIVRNNEHGTMWEIDYDD